MFETEVNTSYALDLALSTPGTCWLGLVTKQKQATDQQGGNERKGDGLCMYHLRCLSRQVLFWLVMLHRSSSLKASPGNLASCLSTSCCVTPVWGFTPG